MDKYYTESSLSHRRCAECGSKLHQRAWVKDEVIWEKCYCVSKVSMIMGGITVTVESWSPTVHRGDMIKIVCVPVGFDRTVTSPMLFGALVDLQVAIDEHNAIQLDAKTE